MDFFQIVWSIILIVVFFGGSIFIHELGHYLAARRRGLKVERFSIGFGPKLWSTTRDGVEWCVCAFPLGGYVALPQLADLEGIEGKYEGEKLPPISYKSTVIVAVMGVVFNILFAFALATLLWVIGRPVPASQNTTTVGTVMAELDFDKTAKVAGPGVAAVILPLDKILEIDGVKIKDWRDVKQMIITGTERDPKDKSPICSLKVLRSNEIVNISAHPVLYGPEKLRSLGILPYEKLVVEKVAKNSPAEKAGIKTNDVIATVQGSTIYDYYSYQSLIENNGLKPLTVTYLQNEAPTTVEVTPEMVKVSKKGDQQASIGITFQMQVVIIKQDPFTQLADATALTWRTLTTLVNPSSDIKLQHLSGPPGIAWMIYRLSDDLRRLLYFIVVINVNLAILNLLPLPVLDGGQIVIATINKLRKKAMPVQVVAMLQNIFAIGLLLMMVYVIFFADVPRVGREWKEQQQYKESLKDEITPVFDAQSAPAETPAK